MRRKVGFANDCSTEVRDVATQMTIKPQKVRHRCDWMTNEQLKMFIESLSSLLFEALEEQRERQPAAGVVTPGEGEGE